MDELINKHMEWVTSHPRHGYLIVAVLLLFWLFGVIRGWKWTYEPNTWGRQLIQEIFGKTMCRICTGILLVIALICVAYLYFTAEQ